METLHEIVLLKVQYNIEQELMRQLESNHYYTGHSLVVKDIDDVKNSMITYVHNELDTAQRRLYLLMK